MKHFPVDAASTEFIDHPPVPLLYVQNLNENFQQKVCRQFTLNAEKIADGCVYRSSTIKNNFKFSYLDLFFSGLFILKHNPQISFFIFEKNQLKEELEFGILGQISNETGVDFQIQQWNARRSSAPTVLEFSFSGLAQATLHQTGFFTAIQPDTLHLTHDQILNIMARLQQTQFRESA